MHGGIHVAVALRAQVAAVVHGGLGILTVDDHVPALPVRARGVADRRGVGRRAHRDEDDRGRHREREHRARQGPAQVHTDRHDRPPKSRSLRRQPSYLAAARPLALRPRLTTGLPLRLSYAPHIGAALDRAEPDLSALDAYPTGAALRTAS